MVEGVDVYGASSLSQVVHFLRGDIALDPVRSLNGWSDGGLTEQDLDFGEVKGQQHVKRAVEVVGAGGHNISRLDLFRPNNCELRFLGTKSWRPRGSAKVFTSFSSGHRFPPWGRLGKDHCHPHEMRCSQKLFLNAA